MLPPKYSYYGFCIRNGLGVPARGNIQKSSVLKDSVVPPDNLQLTVPWLGNVGESETVQG